MRNIIVGFALVSVCLVAQELLVVGNKTFPREQLSQEEVKQFFLAKHRFIDNEKILVLNFETTNPLRECFEENILQKSKRSLERYWRKAYYKGIRPPKVVKSQKMLFAYLEEVAPSIGYCDANISLESNLSVLFKVECP